MKSLKIKIIVLLAFLLCLTCKHSNKNEVPKKNTFAITIENVENGKITAKLGKKVLTTEELKAIEEDSLLTFTLEASEKYKVKHLMLGEAKYENVKDKVISVDIKVKKNFTVKGAVDAFFTITINNSENGTLNVLKDGSELSAEELKEVIKNTQVTFKLTSSKDYKPKFLKVGDEIINNDENKLILEKQITITKDIEASFEMEKDPLKTYSVESNGKTIVFKMAKIPEASNVTFGGDYNNGYKNIDNKMNKKHTASLSSFYLCNTETTQELYQAIMNENPAIFKEMMGLKKFKMEKCKKKDLLKK